MMKKKRLWAVLAAVLLLCGGCAPREAQPTPTPAAESREDHFSLPEDIRLNAAGVPQLRVYVTDEKQIHDIDLEEYICGVVAGEMKNDWPEEALKAQAILARTFVVKFITEKQSKYDGADISTDIEEAQAYRAAGINDRVRAAVEATRGQIIVYNGEPIYAWFHAHSGGRTATAEEGLSYRKEAPYTQSIESEESPKAPADDAEWQAEFTQQQVIAAAADAGVRLGDSVKSVAAGAKGESGRLKTFRIDGNEVPANEFRVAIGSADMKSTWITALSIEDGMLKMRGKGYGHGVGMSQWGAYALAEAGKNADNIIKTYFKDISIVRAWD